jgi:hypothetical protein
LCTAQHLLLHAAVIWITIQLAVQELYSHKPDDDVREVQVTDVIKALAMYAQVSTVAACY